MNAVGGVTPRAAMSRASASTAAIARVAVLLTPRTALRAPYRSSGKPESCLDFPQHHSDECFSASADFCVESVRTHGASIQNIYWSCFGAHYEEPTRVSSRTSTTEPIPVFPGLPGSQQTPPVPIGKQPAVEPFPAAVTPKPKASGKEPLSLSSVSDGDSTHQNDGNGPQVIPDPTLPLPSSDGFGEQTTSSMDTPPAGLPTDQDTAAIPMGNPGPWTTPSQAAPTPNADTSAGSTVAASSSSHLEPTISASGVPLRSPVPKPTAATSGDPQPTTMATQITAASPSGAPNTILPTFLSMPDNNLPPTPPMATALAASTAMDANGPSKGPLIGGILTGLVVVITLTATCLVYLYRGKRKQHREEEAAARAEAAAAAAAAAEQARPVLSRSHASSSASSAVSNSISEFQIQQATAVRYQRCGPHAPGRQVQLSWSGGGGIGQAQRTTKSLETATRSAATPEEDLSSRGGH